VAWAAGAQPEHVDIVSVTPSPRRQSETVAVYTRVRFTDEAGVEQAAALLGRGEALKAKVNEALRAQGLRECTGISVGKVAPAAEDRLRCSLGNLSWTGGPGNWTLLNVSMLAEDGARVVDGGASGRGLVRGLELAPGVCVAAVYLYAAAACFFGCCCCCCCCCRGRKAKEDARRADGEGGDGEGGVGEEPQASSASGSRRLDVPASRPDESRRLPAPQVRVVEAQEELAQARTGGRACAGVEVEVEMAAMACTSSRPAAPPSRPPSSPPTLGSQHGVMISMSPPAGAAFADAAPWDPFSDVQGAQAVGAQGAPTAAADGAQGAVGGEQREGGNVRGAGLPGGRSGASWASSDALEAAAGPSAAAAAADPFALDPFPPSPSGAWAVFGTEDDFLGGGMRELDLAAPPPADPAEADTEDVTRILPPVEAPPAPPSLPASSAASTPSRSPSLPPEGRPVSQASRPPPPLPARLPSPWADEEAPERQTASLKGNPFATPRQPAAQSEPPSRPQPVPAHVLRPDEASSFVGNPF